MEVKRGLTGIGLLVLVAAAAAGLYLTSPAAAPRSTSEAAPPLSGESLSLDPRYLRTALQLAEQAETTAQRRAARSALNAADHELDMQYAYALQLASIAPIPASPKIRALQERIATIDRAIATRQQEVSQLDTLIRRLHGARRSALQQQLDVRRAELGLFHEALDDANESLDRAGGSLQGRLAQLKAQHVALSKEHDTFEFPPYARSPASGSLLARAARCKAAGRTQSQVRQAWRAAEAEVAGLRSQRGSLKKRIAAEEAQRRDWEKNELTPRQIAALQGSARGRPPRRAKAAAVGSALALLAQGTLPSSLIALIQRISSDRIMLRILALRDRDMGGLAAAYARWGALEDAAVRADLHRLIASCLWIVLTMASAFFLNRVIERLFGRLAVERKQKATLQAVLQISARLLAVIAILMIIFGAPHNLSTVLGLAGAGLAIALQDFILSFMGWFVLMGRHGIRVGDFVEITTNSFSGVRGEVVEITLFRTVLLETGNANEPGHHTGRKVAFMNMYAVTGYYFNFSTSGQWLWDELQVAIPRGENPYPIGGRIRAIVAGATEGQTQQAEREWKNVSARYGTRSFSAGPTVTIRASDSGATAVVRYITRADERPAMRNRLSQEITKLLHQGEEFIAGAESQPETEPAASTPR
ncbi:MAG: mechanosensitive ion channel [Proteobacteria bacterium]|nr:mechanosensitive ion channel [Pseudomonadota bacterium]